MVEGPNVRLGNGVELLGEMNCYFDPVDIGHSGIYCLSHAHFDHLPSKMMREEVVCSPITQRCAQDRLKRNLRIKEHPRVKMLESGHILGSNMFLFEGDQRVLYTGDMCPRDRLGLKGSKPVKTDVLIIESTFGLPRYIFPPMKEMEKKILDWVEDRLASGRSVAVLAYPLGKSQEMLMLFKDMAPYLYGSSLRTTQLMEDVGEEFSYRPFDHRRAEEPFLLICPTEVRRASFIESLRRKGMLTVSISGWAVDSSFKYRMGVDETFPMSDHADFNDLLWFIEKCEPSVVYTHHGFERDLASQIRTRLGIEAYPLVKDQRSLLEF